MRPRIGKARWWDKVTPTEQKEIDKTAKKWVVVRYMHIWNDPHQWEIQSRWIYEAREDSDTLRWALQIRMQAEIVMEKLNERDAHMWAKMM